MSRVLMVLAAVAAVAGAACGNGEDTGVIAASGHVEATDVRLSAKVAGHGEAIPLQEGDRVSITPVKIEGALVA